jgi:hypothetical protein
VKAGLSVIYFSCMNVIITLLGVIVILISLYALRLAVNHTEHDVAKLAILELFVGIALLAIAFTLS